MLFLTLIVLFNFILYRGGVIISDNTLKRTFGSIVYPDSAPPDWMDILKGLYIPAFISPLHDMDYFSDGSPKKPHYHIMLLFEGKKSSKAVKEILSKIGAVGLEDINSRRGYARYLCHLDDPDKVKYNIEDVLQFSGASYLDTISLPTDDPKIYNDILNFICERDIKDFSILIDYAREYNLEWFNLLTKKGVGFFKEYLSSRNRVNKCFY